MNKAWKVWLKDGTSMYKDNFHYLNHNENVIELKERVTFKGKPEVVGKWWWKHEVEGEEVDKFYTKIIINKDIFSHAELLED